MLTGVVFSTFLIANTLSLAMDFAPGLKLTFAIAGLLTGITGIFLYGEVFRRSSPLTSTIVWFITSVALMGLSAFSAILASAELGVRASRRIPSTQITPLVVSPVQFSF